MSVDVYSERLTYTIAYRAGHLDAWTTLAGAYLDQLTLRQAPGFSQAMIRYHYGRVMHDTLGTANREALDLQRMLVKVTVTGTTQAGLEGQTMTWYGYVSDQSDQVLARVSVDTEIAAAGHVDTGVTTYTCYGLERLLDEVYLSHSWTKNGRIERPLSYNIPPRQRNVRLAGNRSQAESGGTYVHDQASGTGGDTWSALDVAEVLCRIFADAQPFTVTLEGQTASLSFFEDAWQWSERTTVWQALQGVIPATRGYTFFAYSTDGTTIKLRVSTTVSIDVTDNGDTIIPASDRTVSTLSLAASERIAPPSVEYIMPPHRIVVEGEYLRTCFTMQYGWGTLENGWTAAEEAAYNALDSKARSAVEQSSVWSRYVLPPDWDGNMDDGTPRNCLPVIDPSDGSVDTSQQQPVYIDGVCLDQDLPLSTADGQPRPILAVVTDADGNFQRLDRQQLGKTKSLAKVCVLDDGPGVEIDGQHQTMLAANHEPTEGYAPDPDYDWQNLYVTVAMQTHERLRVEKSVSAAEADEPERVLRLTVANAGAWYVVPGTVTDAVSTALTTSAGGTVRDDSAMLRRIAAFAEAWYGQRRARLAFAYRIGLLLLDGAGRPMLGYLIDEADLGTTVTPAGTILSEIAYRFDGGHDHTEQQSVAVKTEWRDLDIPSVYQPGNRAGRQPGSMSYGAAMQSAQPTNYPAIITGQDAPPDAGPAVVRKTGAMEVTIGTSGEDIPCMIAGQMLTIPGGQTYDLEETVYSRSALLYMDVSLYETTLGTFAIRTEFGDVAWLGVGGGSPGHHHWATYPKARLYLARVDMEQADLVDEIVRITPLQSGPWIVPGIVGNLRYAETTQTAYYQVSTTAGVSQPSLALSGQPSFTGTLYLNLDGGLSLTSSASGTVVAVGYLQLSAGQLVEARTYPTSQFDFVTPAV